MSESQNQKNTTLESQNCERCGVCSIFNMQVQKRNLEEIRNYDFEFDNFNFEKHGVINDPIVRRHVSEFYDNPCTCVMCPTCHASSCRSAHIKCEFCMGSLLGLKVKYRLLHYPTRLVGDENDDDILRVKEYCDICHPNDDEPRNLCGHLNIEGCNCHKGEDTCENECQCMRYLDCGHPYYLDCSCNEVVVKPAKR